MIDWEKLFISSAIAMLATLGIFALCMIVAFIGFLLSTFPLQTIPVLFGVGSLTILFYYFDIPNLLV